MPDIPTGLSLVCDISLLSSAVNAPFQTYNGIDLYPTLPDKAARLCFGLIRDHPFVDGNKRIGTHAMLVLLALNNIELSYEDQGLISLILSVAAGNSDEKSILEWIRSHIK